MTTQRLRILPDIPVPVRSRSLRRILWIGASACLALAIVAFVGVTGRILDLTERRAQERGRYNLAIVDHKDRLAALYEQHIAQRAYFTLGGSDLLDAYSKGRERELAAFVALDEHLDGADEAALSRPLGDLDTVIRTWREDVWSPRIYARAGMSAPEVAAALAPTLDAAAKAFDQVRIQHTTVDRRLQELGEARIAAFQRSLVVVVIGGVVLIVLTAGFVLGTVAWILRRTVRPLEELSRIAATGAAFPSPEAGTGIREVDALTTALFELDITVRDREQRLAASHAEAVDLSRFGEHVQQITDETELHEALAARLSALTPGSEVHTLMRNASQSRLDVALSTTGPIDPVRLPILGEPMRCRAVRTLKRVLDIGGSTTACRCALAPTQTPYLCTPMLAAGELIGVCNLQSAGPELAPVEQSLHNTMGFASTALASIRLLAATRDRALRDPLTGAYNRGFLNEFLGKQLALAERNEGTLGVLLLDLDHFKRLNDTFGHAIGDRALIAAVAAAQRQVRASDAVVRYGGEEIVVVLADTDVAGAVEAAERVRRAIEEVALASDQGTVTVRASIGVAAFPLHGRDQPALLAAADRALYQAKAAGRNRVVAAPADSGASASQRAPAPAGN